MVRFEMKRIDVGILDFSLGRGLRRDGRMYMYMTAVRIGVMGLRRNVCNICFR